MLTLANKVQLIGHLGNAPELKNLESGKKVVRFSLATNESYKNQKGEQVTETQWHNIVLWGKLAENANKLLSKGSRVLIEGKISYRDYTDSNSVKRYLTEIQANEFLMLDKSN